MVKRDAACPSAIGGPLQGTVAELQSREWLIANGRGGFASGTVLGCSARKFHGLLIASWRPPLERFLLLAGTVDRVCWGDGSLDISTWEFNHGFEPDGYRDLREFDYNLSSPDPWVQWSHAGEGVEVRRRVTLVTGRPMVRVRYDVAGPADRKTVLEVAPLLAMRDFHALRRQAAAETWDTHSDGHWLWAQDRRNRDITLAMFARSGEGLKPARFGVEMAWWHNVRYRTEAEREYLCGEDLQRAGTFRCKGTGAFSAEFVAVGFATSPEDAKQAAEAACSETRRPAVHAPAGRSPVRHAMEAAADQFVVRRGSAGRHGQATILAGYPWFGDWGRDSFIALEGLLLRTGRFEEARQVLHMFAGAQRNGLIPNRFDDYGGECEYNSVDASLWFVHGADVYLSLSGDHAAWEGFLAPVCQRIVEAFIRGTDFDIGLDANGLVHCGNPAVQITWMDAKCGDVVFTPRHGRPVEVNALWYHALRVLDRRFAETHAVMSAQCRSLAEQVVDSFEPVFWNARADCLYDCVRDDEKDGAIRPNQVFAVSLAHSPLSDEAQAAVLDSVTRHLLTPYGLRSLAPSDPQYRGVCTGVQRKRDEAYHNGTVWAWLIGPYADAWLQVGGDTPGNREHVRGLVQPLLDHMAEAGLGSISEIFDGDAPHTPRGCIAQAWSVAEVLRILDKVEAA